MPVSVDDGGVPDQPPGDHQWTTGGRPVDDDNGALTSADGISSTIHSPYYRHCQNLNSLERKDPV